MRLPHSWWHGDAGKRIGIRKVVRVLGRILAACCAVLLVGPLQAGADTGGGDTLSLEEAIGQALNKNENLLVAQAQRHSERQRWRETRSNALPSLDWRTTYNRNWVRPTFVFGGNSFRSGTDNNINSRLELRQAVYSGGRLGAALDAIRHNEAYAAQVERGTVQQIRAEVEEGLNEVLLARELDGVSRQALETAQANLRQVEALYRGGRVPEFDLLQARVQVASLQADSIRASNAVDLSEMRFKNGVGEPLDSPRRPAGHFRSRSPMEGRSADELLQVAIRKRAAVLQADDLLRAGRRTIDLERAQNNPSLDFVSGAQVQFQSDECNVGDDGVWARSWSTGIELEMPLFDGHRTGARVSQARLQVKRLELQRQQTLRAVELEVRQALMLLDEAGQRLKAQAVAVQYASRGLEVAQARYRNGAGTQLEIHDAQFALVQARSAQARARRDRAGALIEIERATGVLGEETGP